MVSIYIYFSLYPDMPNKRIHEMTRKSIKQKLKRVNSIYEIIDPQPSTSCNTYSENVQNRTSNKCVEVVTRMRHDDCLHSNLENQTDFDTSNASSGNPSTSSSDYENGILTKETSVKLSVNDFMSTWAIRHNIIHVALNELLQYFRDDYSSLPLDARTLLNTPRVKHIQIIEPGEYIHIGLKNGLDNIRQQCHQRSS